jgi:hypothetical protein
MVDHDSSHNDGDNVNKGSRCKKKKSSSSATTVPSREMPSELTRLKNQIASDFYIAAIAGGLYALVCANEGTYHKRGGLADVVKRSELDHEGRMERKEGTSV